jgi:hypothetical protein
MSDWKNRNIGLKIARDNIQGNNIPGENIAERTGHCDIIF